MGFTKRKSNRLYRLYIDESQAHSFPRVMQVQQIQEPTRLKKSNMTQASEEKYLISAGKAEEIYSIKF